jgi:sporulation protein YlmC with PRC-barrel domain
MRRRVGGGEMHPVHGQRLFVTFEDLKELQRAPLYTADGEQFGHVGEIWFNEETGRAHYLKVGRPPLGLRAVLVPVQGGRRHADGFQVPYTRDELEGSPEFDPDDWDDVRARDFTSCFERHACPTADADAALTRSADEHRPDERGAADIRIRLRRWDGGER